MVPTRSSYTGANSFTKWTTNCVPVVDALRIVRLSLAPFRLTSGMAVFFPDSLSDLRGPSPFRLPLYINAAERCWPGKLGRRRRSQISEVEARMEEGRVGREC